MADVIDIPQREPLRKRGLGRVLGDERALEINFNRKPTDEELRMIDDWLYMMVNQSGVMESLPPVEKQPTQSGEP